MFLTRLLSDCFTGIFELSAWIGLIVGGVVGYGFTAPKFPGAGWLGAVIGVVIAFLIEVMLWGTIAMLIDVRNSLRDMSHR